ncbi:MAG: hypothetical protein R6T99_07200 [Bacteroidales bacterium]
MKKYLAFLFQVIFVLSICISPDAFSQRLKYTNKNVFRISFYNVENLFDCVDDPEKLDDEYLPWGFRGWGHERLDHKLIRISKTIMAMGDDVPPPIIGLCEVENSDVLRMLVEKTPLQYWGYKYLHNESPDPRGIDVALLYLPACFTPMATEDIPVAFSDSNARQTRNILYVKGMLRNGFDVHMFINHWPSRYGGQLASEQKRMHAATTLKNHIDSMFAGNPEARIIIMGDFNDTPGNMSMKLLTQAKDRQNDPCLINLFENNKKLNWKGTMKYKADWYIFDQILVSENLVNLKNASYIAEKYGNIFVKDFLLMPDEKYTGRKPFRTFYGSKYLGGFSDHLPVYIDLMVPE